MLTYFEAKKFYDAFGIKQDTQAYYENPAIDELLKFADLDQATSVFEFGYGTGRLAKRLLTENPSLTARYYGVDLSSTMFQLAKQRLSEFGERVQISLSDGSPKLDISGGSMDRFLSSYVLDLLSLEDIDAVLAEAHRILKRDGRLCLIGLTYGQSAYARIVSWVWERVYAFRPLKVGGCRPLKMIDRLSDTNWQIEHQSIITAFGISSEIIVATPL